MTLLLQKNPLSSVALGAERPRLVGLCAHLTGDAQAAEDLAQETLVEAWRHRHRLQDAAGQSRWLSAIARHVCRRWQRAHARDLAHCGQADRAQIDAQPDPFDLQRDLERNELATLLDRALARLPPPTRDALVDRYILDTPLAELAARLGLSEAAVAKRLQRGAQMLRALLYAELEQEATDPAGPDPWRQTRIWCPQCGRHRLLGRLPSERSSLRLRCPGCATGRDDKDVYIQYPGLFRDVTSFKPAFSRVLAMTNRRHQAGLAQTSLPCLGCSRPTALLVGPDDPTNGPMQPGTVLTRRCGVCGTFEQTALSVCMLALPPVQRFWRTHPRLSTLPERSVEAEGRPAVVITFQDITSAAQIDLLAASDTGRVLALDGAPYHG